MRGKWAKTAKIGVSRGCQPGVKKNMDFGTLPGQHESTPQICKKRLATKKREADIAGESFHASHHAEDADADVGLGFLQILEKGLGLQHDPSTGH